ncbi:DUF1361 domain-containing protein [Paraflavitalea speifideaquila]|uniref:DUF1361 domain-containing protein n=1 Tax=Paraflavitalea speifideaquila TaxID=3076558 RepID=UPI0028EE2900|nr:DUF1361 domain-containing protein [Paraflavitalea speifideiaquila]
MRNIVRPFWEYRCIFLRSEVDRIMTLSMLFSIGMVMARMVYSGERDYLFLVWNLFLAYIPYFISSWLTRKPSWAAYARKFVLVLGVWIPFIPNSFYILTDLFHLGFHAGAPLWFDLALIISFAWNGLLLGILSVRQMEKFVELYLPGKTTWLFLYPVMVLNALGVYIGRYLRFNSWDVITNPFALVSDIGRMIWHPLEYREVWAMVTCFSVLMILVYTTLKKISKMIW